MQNLIPIPNKTVGSGVPKVVFNKLPRTDGAFFVVKNLRGLGRRIQSLVIWTLVKNRKVMEMRHRVCKQLRLTTECLKWLFHANATTRSGTAGALIKRWLGLGKRIGVHGSIEKIG